MARPSKLDYWLTEGRTALESILTSYKTDKEIMKALGINKTTLYRWKEGSETFRNLYNSKRAEFREDIANSKLEEAEDNLAKLIKGEALEITETQELMIDKDTGRRELVTTKRVVKKAVPNVTAIIFALKNLDPAKWKDRPVLDTEKDELKKVDELLDKITKQALENE